MATLSYPKSVRLHHRKAFEELLGKGTTHYNAVFKVYWLVPSTKQAQNVDGRSDLSSPSTKPAQNVDGSRFAVSVPKKNFKRAVKRNLLKRRIREAIRLNRSRLPEGFAADFLFFYRVPEVLDYAAIEKAVVETFETVAAKAAASAPAENIPDNE